MSQKETLHKKLRLPYAPLPKNAKGIGISNFSRKDSKIRSNWRHIRKEVFEKHGTSCYYCGIPPIKNTHDCHEIFSINDIDKVIRLVDIVPACHQCHEWADGKVFIQPQYFRTQTKLNAFLKSWLGEDYLKDPDYHLIADVQAFNAIRHFRHVNRITIIQAKMYIGEAIRQDKLRSRILKWNVDYNKWQWALNLPSSEFVIAKR